MISNTNTKVHSNRRFHRITLNANVHLTNHLEQTFICQCINFSQDGIDLKRPKSIESFTEMSIQAGSAVILHFDDLENAPNVKAAVIKINSEFISLRLIL